VTNRKAKKKLPSATQLGQGIQKIIDLFHDLPELLDKADKHAMSLRLSPAEMAKIDSSKLAGMTQDNIKDKRQEYIHHHCDEVSHFMTNSHTVGRCKCCYNALKKLNRLIPNFEQNAYAAENVNIYYAQVCHF
jgi:hypothetical protein